MKRRSNISERMFVIWNDTFIKVATITCPYVRKNLNILIILKALKNTATLEICVFIFETYRISPILAPSNQTKSNLVQLSTVKYLK